MSNCDNCGCDPDVKYSKNEILDAVKAAVGGEDTEDYDDFWYDPSDYTLVLRGESIVPKKIDSTGGMDEGSAASTTFKVGSQYYRKGGFYRSHYGYDWDGDFTEVVAVEKTIVVYEPT